MTTGTRVLYGVNGSVYLVEKGPDSLIRCASFSSMNGKFISESRSLPSVHLEDCLAVSFLGSPRDTVCDMYFNGLRSFIPVSIRDILGWAESVVGWEEEFLVRPLYRIIEVKGGALTQRIVLLPKTKIELIKRLVKD